jgi:signal transduction histidine kinase
MQQMIPEASASEPAAAGLQAALTIALAGLCYLLYRRYRKSYYLIWTGAWLLYSVRLGVIFTFLVTGRPLWLYWHQVATGLTALALLWAALAFSQGTRWRGWYAVLIAFPVVWSYIAIYRMDNFMLAAAPAVLFLSLATLWTGVVFLQHYRRVGSGASLFLAIALVLWAVHHLDYPFLRARGVWNPWGYYIDSVFELAMGLGILLIVGEELQRGLHTLSALSTHLQARDASDLPRLLLERAMTLPGVRGSALLLRDGDGAHVVQGAGVCSAWEVGPADAHATDAVTMAMQERRPVVESPAAPTRGAHAWVAALPILSRDDVRGALVVVGQARDPFAALDTDFLLALGRQFGAALENAELYERLQARTADLERLAARMVRQHEEERHRLSRELHDETAQVLAAVNLQLGLLRESSPEASPRLDRALGLVDDGIRSIRAVTYRLRPPLLDDLGLRTALRGLVDEFAERFDIGVAFDAPPTLPALNHDAELALFRALQEALSNIARHAGAQHVQVRICPVGQSVRLEVRDDGAGLRLPQDDRPASAFGGTGLDGMRERLALLGGRLDIRNVDRGVELTVVLPLDKDDRHER